MSYIYGLVVVALLAYVLHFYTELRTMQKLGVTGAILLVILAAIAYNEYSDTKSRHVYDMETRYRQNKMLTCEGIDLNQSTFSYSEGTRTLIGREGSEHYNRMISLEQCR